MNNKLGLSINSRTNKGKRECPSAKELQLFIQQPHREGGSKRVRVSASRFAGHFSTALTRYPVGLDQPKWLRALVKTRASVDQLVTIARDRLWRAPTKSNQELALVLANEIARIDGGKEVLEKHFTPDLFSRLSGKGDK